MKNILIRVVVSTFLVAVSCQNEVRADNAPIKEVLVTGDRFGTSLKELPGSVTMITEDQIESSKLTDLQDILRTEPSIDVVRSGGLGGNTALFLRGANSEHTLVLIDGIEANDPVSPTRAFNFSDITLDNIEKIEVLRGPQSVLYGSDALGGVISITTKRGEGKPTGFLQAEGGSFNTFIEKAGVSGSDGIFDYSLGTSREDSDSISAADSKDGNSERDGYGKSAVSSRIGITPSKEVNADLFFRYNQSTSDLDNFGGPFGDDPNRVLDNHQLFTRAEVNLSLFDEQIKQKYGVSYSEQWINDDNFSDDAHPGESQISDYRGRMLKFDLQNNIALTKSLSSVLGVETREERADSSLDSVSSFGPFSDKLEDKSARNNAVYLQGKWKASDEFIPTAGVRLDDNPKFGDEVTWKASPVVILGATRLFGAIGSGYKAPSLFQLYSQYGNEGLEPEKSKGWEAGIEESLLKKAAKVGVTYFHNDFDNLITFDPTTFISENINKATTKGVELYTSYDLSESLSAGVNYTFLDTEDESTGDELLRRARNKIGGVVTYKPLEAVAMRLGVSYIGKRIDNDFSTTPAARTELSGYTLVSLAASYDISKNVQLFIRGENMLDQSYQDVLGFGTAGIAGFGGVKVSL